MLFLTAALLFAPHYEVTIGNDVRNAIYNAASGIYFVAFDVNGANPQITHLDAEGRGVYQVSPNPAGTTVAAYGPFATDAQGNLYALTSLVAANNAEQCLMTKLDPNGNTLYSFSLPQQPDICFGQSSAAAIAVGPQGSVFLIGSDSPLGLATTAGAYVTASAAAPNQVNAYVVQVNPQGTGIVYSTFLDSGRQQSSVSALPNTNAIAIAVDSQGNAYVAGTTEDSAFPTSAGAMITVCNCASGKKNFFVVKLTSSGQMSYSTFMTPPPLALSPFPPFLNIAVDAGLEATVMHLPYPPGTAPSSTNTPTVIGTITLNSSGSGSLNNTTITFGGGYPIAFTPDGEGNLLVTGTNAASSLPLSPGAFTNGTAFAAMVRIADSSVLYATLLPNGSAVNILADGSGGFVTIGALTGNYPNRATQITRFIPAAAASPTVLGVANAAGLQVSPGLAPGELVSIYGVNLGPGAGIAAAFDSTGTLPKSLGGTTVYLNGIPAPLLYVGNQQVNAIVPFAVPGGESMSVMLLVNGVQSNEAFLPENGADPEIFKSSVGGVFVANGYPNSFALNQDGTVNSLQNPAIPGTIITFFVSGAGLLNPPPVDGQRGGLGPLLFLPLTVTALFSQAGSACCASANVPIVYAGSAPILAAGMVQLNLRLPSGIAVPNSGTQEAGFTLAFGNQGATTPEDFIATGAIWISGGN